MIQAVDKFIQYAEEKEIAYNIENYLRVHTRGEIMEMSMRIRLNPLIAPAIKKEALSLMYAKASLMGKDYDSNITIPRAYNVKIS